MPATNWDEEIDWSDLRRASESGELTFTQFRDGFCERLAKSKWAREEEDVRELIEDVRRTENEDEFDEELEYLYDRTDSDNIWLGS